MEQVRSLLNKRFGRLVVIRLATKDQYPRKAWICMCDCGKEHLVRESHLIAGDCTSCGCRAKEIGRSRRKHGHAVAETKIYKVWTGMLQRCRNQGHKQYGYYGGRGISVCDQWINFVGFLRDMGPSWEEGLSLDRINNDGNYEPSNCRWATKKQQSRNTRSNRLIEINGKRLCIAAAADAYGIPEQLLRNRLRHGWPVQAAIYAKKRSKLKRFLLGQETIFGGPDQSIGLIQTQEKRL